jgi:hypothetical protein
VTPTSTSTETFEKEKGATGTCERVGERLGRASRAEED